MSPDDLHELERIVAIVDQFESAWRRGDRPRIEDVLEAAAPGELGELLQYLLEIELEILRQRGETPSPNDYWARFPQDSAILDQVFGDDSPPDLL
jgi:hypothetical protein